MLGNSAMVDWENGLTDGRGAWTVELFLCTSEPHLMWHDGAEGRENDMFGHSIPRRIRKRKEGGWNLGTANLESARSSQA